MLEAEGKGVLAQSHAILRCALPCALLLAAAHYWCLLRADALLRSFAGRLAGLYPVSDAWLAAQCDEALAAIYDIRIACDATRLLAWPTQHAALPFGVGADAPHCAARAMATWTA
jgi:hypothetical protein